MVAAPGSCRECLTLVGGVIFAAHMNQPCIILRPLIDKVTSVSYLLLLSAVAGVACVSYTVFAVVISRRRVRQATSDSDMDHDGLVARLQKHHEVNCVSSLESTDGDVLDEHRLLMRSRKRRRVTGR